VPDIDAFEECARKRGPVPAIESDVAEVRRIGGTGTPTFVINGVLLRPPYSTAGLLAHVRAALRDAK